MRKSSSRSCARALGARRGRVGRAVWCVVCVCVVCVRVVCVCVRACVLHNKLCALHCRVTRTRTLAAGPPYTHTRHTHTRTRTYTCVAAHAHARAQRGAARTWNWPWMSPQTVTGQRTGCTLVSCTRISLAFSHSTWGARGRAAGRSARVCRGAAACAGRGTVAAPHWCQRGCCGWHRRRAARQAPCTRGKQRPTDHRPHTRKHTRT
jgi:hypothetical protein